MILPIIQLAGSRVRRKFRFPRNFERLTEWHGSCKAKVVTAATVPTEYTYLNVAFDPSHALFSLSGGASVLCRAIGLSRRVDAGTTYRTPFGNKRGHVSVEESQRVCERASVCPATVVARECIIDTGSPWISSISHLCGAPANIPRGIYLSIYRCTRVPSFDAVTCWAFN